MQCKTLDSWGSTACSRHFFPLQPPLLKLELTLGMFRHSSSILILRPLSFKPNYSSLISFNFSVNFKVRAMSSQSKPPSAFDKLMSNARKRSKAAADAKKNSNSSITNSSPKKSKTQDPICPTSENPNSNKTLESNLNKPIKSSPEKHQTQDPISPILDNSNGKKPIKSNSKKVEVNVDEFVINLKKKPANFDPKSAAWWEDGEKVPFLFLAKAFELIKGESGRIVITDITCNLLRTVISKTSDDLLAVVYLLANKIAPAHQGLELGIGEASLIKALAEACGTSEAVVKKKYQV